ncbi:dihydropteroate synthase [soil metagenome]
MDATPSVGLPPGTDQGLPRQPPAPMTIGRRAFEWGSRTFVMGIVNVTPDSFSGDGLLDLSSVDSVAAAVEQGRRMRDEGADMLDVGGESSRPGHPPVPAAEEIRRVAPVIEAIRNAMPEMPISIDTTKPEVATAALDAGADMLNDIWGVRDDEAMMRLAAERDVPLVLMHNRRQPRYRNFLAEVMTDLQRAIERAVLAGAEWEQLIVDPGIGFGKTAEQNLLLLRELAVLRVLGRPILLGTSRKSTIGRVLDLPAAERLEGTLATSALAIASGADLLRVHDVAANRRAAMMSDAVIRGGWTEGGKP